MTVLEIEKMLVKRAVNGDKAALERLWISQLRHLRNFLKKRICDPELRRDVEQQTALMFCRKLHQFKGDTALHYWLFSVALNEFRQCLRKGTRQLRREEASLQNLTAGHEITDGAWLEAPQYDINAQIDARREIDAIAARASRLNPAYIRPWALAIVTGLGWGEIAKIEGRTLPSIKSRIHRTRQALFHGKVSRAVANW
jgi:RNA polymerase sigma-70 factor (ECF subfamily)